MNGEEQLKASCCSCRLAGPTDFSPPASLTTLRATSIATVGRAVCDWCFRIMASSCEDSCFLARDTRVSLFGVFHSLSHLLPTRCAPASHSPDQESFWLGLVKDRAAL